MRQLALKLGLLPLVFSGAALVQAPVPADPARRIESFITAWQGGVKK